MSAQSDNTRLNDLEYRRGQLVLESRPRTVDLGLTLKCNLRCVMCISRHLPQIDLATACLQRVEPYLQYCEQITWNDAGELFASQRVQDFIRLSAAVRPPISYVSTNGQLIGPHVDAIVASGLTHMSVSIDASRPETYEHIRRGARWDRLIANLDALQRKKAELASPWPRLTFVFVLMRRNIGELVEFIDFAHSHGAQRIEVFRLAPNHTGLERSEAPSDEETRAVYKQALRRADEIGIEIQHTFFSNDVLRGELRREAAADAPVSQTAAAPAPAAQAALSAPAAPASPAPPLPLETLHARRYDVAAGLIPVCPAPWREFLIQTDGKVRTCCYSQRVMGDLNTQTMPEIWNGPEYRDFRRRIVLRDYTHCRDCHFLARTLAGGAGDDARLAPARGDDTWLSERQQAALPALQAHVSDIDRIQLFRSALMNGHLKTALFRLRPALRPMARTLLRAPWILGRLATAWTEQRMANRALHRHFSEVSGDLQVAEEAIRLVLGERGMPEPVVSPGQSFVDALFYSAAITPGGMPEAVEPGATFQVDVSVRNTGALTWPTAGESAVRLAYGWRFANGAVHVQDGLRTPLPQPVAAGGVVSVRASVQAPAQGGDYILVWDLVYDPHAWFKDRGCPPVEVPVRIGLPAAGAGEARGT